MKLRSITTITFQLLAAASIVCAQDEKPGQHQSRVTDKNDRRTVGPAKLSLAASVWSLARPRLENVGFRDPVAGGTGRVEKAPFRVSIPVSKSTSHNMP
jgi:hypothetical protein